MIEIRLAEHAWNILSNILGNQNVIKIYKKQAKKQDDGRQQ